MAGPAAPPLWLYQDWLKQLEKKKTRTDRTTLWVVRHAEREDNVNRAWRQGHGFKKQFSRDDSPLSKRGVEQANECAYRFEHIEFDHVFSSPFERCMATTTFILGRRWTPIKVEPGLCEVLYMCERPAGFKDVSQLKSSYPVVDHNYVPVYQKRELDHAYERFPSDIVCVPRIRRTLRHILDFYKGSILIVTHGAVAGAIHQILTGEWKPVGQATVSKFVELQPGKFICEFSGDSTHLSDRTNLRAY